MENYNKELVDQLNHLITICNDGKYGYETAAQDAESHLLKVMFLTNSVERTHFVNVLHEEVRKAGGNPEEGGGPLGAIHRAWIDVKTALSTKDDKAVLGACITGERAALNAYDDVLEKNYLSAYLRNVLTDQRFNIEEILNKVEAMHEKISLTS